MHCHTHQHLAKSLDWKLSWVWTIQFFAPTQVSQILASQWIGKKEQELKLELDHASWILSIEKFRKGVKHEYGATQCFAVLHVSKSHFSKHYSEKNELWRIFSETRENEKKIFAYDKQAKNLHDYQVWAWSNKKLRRGTRAQEVHFCNRQDWRMCSKS